MRKFHIFVRTLAFTVSSRIRDIKVINILNFVLRVTVVYHAQSVAAPLLERVKVRQLDAVLGSVDAFHCRRWRFFFEYVT